MTALRRPRAILFDWDNTLVDNWGVIAEAFNATLTAMGQPAWTLAETRQRLKASLRDSFPRLFGERRLEAEKIYYAQFEAAHLERLVEMPGAGAMLAHLEAHRIYLGVVSNKKGHYLRKEASHLGWTRHFGRLVGAGDAAADKPSPAPVALALEAAGIAPGPDVWLVGDADIDLECAFASGCLPLLLRAQPPQPGEFEGRAPSLHLPDCDALRQLIDKL
ncbi:MAG: HAD family hydrolase [Pseudomonadota bacterium]